VCYDEYITIDSSTPSRSGLYAIDLPGVEINLLADITPSDYDDYIAFWQTVYKRAWNNLVSDISNKLTDKFFVDLKLISRETSQFEDGFNSGGIAGVLLKFDLPKYAYLHVIDIEVISEQNYNSPDFEVNFYNEEQDGDLLYSVGEELTEGRNSIHVDTDFETNELFIGYDSSLYSLRKTSNKYFNNELSKIACTIPCAFGVGSVQQISGGGLNVNYVVYCSVEKFVCKNINLFKQAFLWRVGNEILIERRYGNTVNCFTAMKKERAEELTEFYTNTYNEKVDNGIKGHNILEDPYCFNCKNTVTTKTLLP